MLSEIAPLTVGGDSMAIELHASEKQAWVIQPYWQTDLEYLRWSRAACDPLFLGFPQQVQNPVHTRMGPAQLQALMDVNGARLSGMVVLDEQGVAHSPKAKRRRSQMDRAKMLRIYKIQACAATVVISLMAMGAAFLVQMDFEVRTRILKQIVLSFAIMLFAVLACTCIGACFVQIRRLKQRRQERAEFTRVKTVEDAVRPKSPDDLEFGTKVILLPPPASKESGSKLDLKKSTPQLEPAQKDCGSLPGAVDAEVTDPLSTGH